MSIRSIMDTEVFYSVKTKPTGTWGDLGMNGEPGKTWGKLEPSSGQKRFIKGKEERVSSHSLMLLPSELNNVDELTINDKKYEILHIGDFGDHLEIDLEHRG